MTQKIESPSSRMKGMLVQYFDRMNPKLLTRLPWISTE